MVAPEPVVEAVPEPVVEAVPEPVVVASEPVVEAAAEPVVEAASESVVEAAAEPVVEAAAEPAAPVVTTPFSTWSPEKGGSMYFTGENNCCVNIANHDDLRFKTDDFTIEWYQYMLNADRFPRLFSMGAYISRGASIGVSIEGGSFIFWANSRANFIGSVNPVDKWVHYAVVRRSGALNVYENGNQIGSTLPLLENFNDTVNALTIGSEGVPESNNDYKGHITNFRWTKGVGLYSGNFSAPSIPLPPVSGTKLLLNATSSDTVLADTSGSNKIITNFGVTWNSKITE